MRPDRHLPCAQRKELDTRIARLAQRDWGVVSTAELLALGLSYRAISTRLANGSLHRMHQGVHAVGHANVPLQGRFLAAVKACGAGAVLSHFAAAVLWRLVTWDHRPVDVIVPGPGARRHDGVRVRRNALDRRDRTTHQGIPVTSPARTVLDCAALLDDRSTRSLIREGLGRGLFTVDELVELLGRAGTRPGTRRLRRILAAGPAPTRSVLEDVVLDLLLEAGFARPDVNVPLVVAGRRIVPDFRWPDARLVVEADGAAWHDNQVAREDDAARQALLEASGEHVLRVTWAQALGRPQQTVARILAAGAPRVSPSLR